MKMTSRFLIFLMLFIRAVTSQAVTDKTNDYIFNENCRIAYKHILSLNLDEARQILNSENHLNNNNLIPYYLYNYIDCVEILFNGLGNNLSAKIKTFEGRLAILEKGNTNNPWYRYCKASAFFHLSLINLKAEENIQAAIQFRKSFLLLKQNAILYPTFAENRVLLGLEKVIAGAIPNNYKLVASMLGINGDINAGSSQIAKYLNSENKGLLYDEAKLYYAYILFYLQGKQEMAWQFVSSSNFEEKENLLDAFVKVNIALNYRKAAHAEQIMKHVFKIENSKKYPIFLYEMAESLLPKKPSESIQYYLNYVTRNPKGHFVKDAYMKIVWAYYLMNNKEAASKYVSMIPITGKTLTDADKQAQSFAKSPKWPMPELLQIRLLVDGGFYNETLKIIELIKKSNLKTVENILDYNFRYGRILEELGHENNAIIFYDAVIKLGKLRTEHFAARAALQKAFIYERKGQYQDAIKCYKECLSMRSHDMQNSIDQLAKAGLNRLQGRVN